MIRLTFSVCCLIILASGVNSLYRQKRIVGGRPAAQPPEDDPVVYVNRRDRDARIYGQRDPNKGFYVFRGIRYAEPPVGSSRFQRPTPTYIEGEFNATRWGPPCPQEYKGEIVGSEDCLFLNVFTPALPDSGDGYPVLIWIHGGGFRTGAACQYEMRNLIKQNLVVVSIQYRLGSLGFLSTGSLEFPGNNGMFDMVLAVNWVKQYIEYFGGNPKNIVAFGQGTGASAALMLSLSKITQNFFSGLIAMSGSILSHFVFDKDPLSTSKKIAAEHNCPLNNITTMVHCLQELPVNKLIASDSKLASFRMTQGFISEISSLFVPGPVVDGKDDKRALPNFMTDTPENSLSLSKFPSIPLLTGVVQDETGGAISGGFKEEVEKKLNIPDFLNTELITSLQGTISIFGNASRQFVPEAFNKYLRISKLQQNIKLGIEKVTEAVNDAIFNVPALLTIKYWNQKAKTIFYSFDFKKSRKNNFLTGLPLADAQDSSDAAGHGNDLGYIFGENDIHGKSIDQPYDENSDEEKVSDTFTGMIAQFARSGEVGASSGNETTFVSVTDKIAPLNSSRLCQVGLWTGAVETLTSSSCDFLRVTTETIQRLTAQTTKLTHLAGSSIEKLQNVGEKVIPDIVKPEIPLPKPKLPRLPTNKLTSLTRNLPSFGFMG